LRLSGQLFLYSDGLVVTSSTTCDASITVFVCANCARGGLRPSPTGHRPSLPEFGWPFAAKEVMVSCTGKLQPENLLKPLEAGSDAVCVIACAEDNCHQLEGSRRVRRRVEYVAGLLDEVSLGADRVMLCHLPGSAREDMSAGATGEATAPPEALSDQLQTVRREIVARVESLTPNPLRDQQATEQPTTPPTESDNTDDSDNELG